MKYIDVKKLIVEIERRIKSVESCPFIEAEFGAEMRREGKIQTYNEILSFINSLQQEQTDMGEVSDGYHTFNELYYYRMLYNAAFFNLLPKEWVHKSKRHHTGEECFGGGWFIVMANLPTGQISNHYELKDWDLFKVPEKEFADEWDGHTPQEAAERLYKYLQQEWHEIDLDAEIEMEWDSFNKHLVEYGKESEEVVWLNRFSFEDIAHYFCKLGRKQVLQEIYDGKTKPVDKITAAWLDDKEEDK